MQVTNIIEGQRTALSGIIILSDGEPRTDCGDSDGYLAKLKRSKMQVERGETITLTPEQLRAFEF